VLVWVEPVPVEPLGCDEVIGVGVEVVGELEVVGVDAVVVVGALGDEGVGCVPLPNADDPRYGAFPDVPELAGGVTPTVGVDGDSGFVDGFEPDRPELENGWRTAPGVALALRCPPPETAAVQEAEERVAPGALRALAKPTA
jgi:hypothetical protein